MISSISGLREGSYVIPSLIFVATRANSSKMVTLWMVEVVSSRHTRAVSRGQVYWKRERALFRSCRVSRF